VLVLGLTAACSKSPSTPTSKSKPGSDVVASAMPSQKEFAPASELAPLHFNYDKHDLRAADLATVDQTARWMKSRPEMLVQIAGHGDERGSDAYNMALGERRAQAVKQALTSRGVDPRRVMTTSYGENRPVCRDHTEGCWEKNRRAEFLVKAK
jgi:peptidoglycan-associated lipoprotein